MLAFQTLTYLTIGQTLLKNKLLPNYFTKLTHHSDSIFVRDFFVSECYTGDSKTYTSNNLSNDKDLIKTKFNVDYVFFDSMENFDWSDTTENSYNLSYHTWTARPDWVTFFGLYGISQTEILQIDKKYLYKREATYHWILFFWLHTFEWFESTELNTNIEK